MKGQTCSLKSFTSLCGAYEATAYERLGGQLAKPEGSLAVSDAAPLPVHLDRVVEGLAKNPALPPELIRRLFAHRNGLGSVAKRPDLTDDMIAEIIAVDDHWLVHSLALNRSLPHAFRGEQFVTGGVLLFLWEKPGR
ncbi:MULTISPECIES: hypothetical protein [unclassified Streptomyces]|uniref:hypothetical protein n=1 Tax=unclassified Streptomyces TaxID=2593676 RepID=UPI000A58BA58|nr:MULTISPECIES: hypothetical protein [unclassified Streptomyces]